MQIQCDICCVKLSCFGLHSSSRSVLLFPTCIILTFVSVGNGADIQVVAYRVRVYMTVVSVDDSWQLLLYFRTCN